MSNVCGAQRMDGMAVVDEAKRADTGVTVPSNVRAVRHGIIARVR